MYLSYDTEKWLKDWFNGGEEIIEISYLVKDEIDCIYYFQPKYSRVLYRAILPTDQIEDGYFVSKKFTTWTYEKQRAEMFMERIIKICVNSKNIFFDSTLISFKTLNKLRIESRNKEVILKPGKYRIIDNL